MFKENLELREQVFKKMGWTTGRHLMQKADWDYLWIDNNGRQHENGLPPIETSWEVCAQYLVPFMKGKGYGEYEIGFGSFWWTADNDFKKNKGRLVRVNNTRIINDNIALAASEAFMEVEL